MGLGRRTFAPGEVLTASNVMNYLQDQVVMNFAGSAARGSAIGTAVQQGMVSYLNSTNALETYNGTTWNALALASAVPTLAGVGLVPMIPTSVSANTGSGSFNSTTGVVTATGYSNLKLNGVFTSAYRNYRVVLDITSTSAAADVDGDLLTAGSSSGTLYRRFRTYLFSSGLGFNYNDGVSNFNFCRSNGSLGIASVTDIIAPQVSGTHKRFIGNAIEGTYQMFPASVNSTTNSFDGLNIIITSGTANATTVKVYGYN